MKTSLLAVLRPSTQRSNGVRCGGCGAEFNQGAWLALALMQRVTSEDLRRFLVRWPEGTNLEIRRCRDCGKNVATKEQA